MELGYKKGKKHAAIFYSIGFGIVAVDFLIFPSGYPHGFLFPLIVFGAFFLISILYLFKSAFTLINKKKRDYAKGALQVHLLALIIWAIVLYVRW